MEAEIAAATVRTQREQIGRGATDVRAYIVGEMAIVRCTGILTPAEAHLIATEEGCKLVQQSRTELRRIICTEMEAMIAGIVGCRVLRSYGDVNAEAGELVEVYILETDLEKRLLRQDLNRLNSLMPNIK